MQRQNETMQENTNEDEYIAAALCRYGGQSPGKNLNSTKEEIAVQGA